MFWVRLAAALVLAPVLSGEVIQSGLAVYGDPLLLLFPYLWLFLVFDYLIAVRGIDDEKVFILGCAFGLLYLGIYTKTLQDGLSPLGINWAGVLSAPAEWGMSLVLLFRVLGAVFPHETPRFSGGKIGWGVIGAVTLVALGRYLINAESGFFAMERFLRSSYTAADLAFAGAAAAVVWPYRRIWLKSALHKGRLVWALGGASLWVLGSSLVSQLLGDALSFVGQIVWVCALLAVGFFLWETRRRDTRRLLMLAAAVHGIGALIFAIGEGISGRTQAQFLSALAIGLPSKILFVLGFLLGRPEV